MGGLSYGKLIGWGLIGLAVLGFVAWAFRADHLRAHWHKTYVEYKKQDEKEDAVVTARIGKAIGNKKLKWEDVPDQVERYANGHDLLVTNTEIANGKIAAMGAETERLKKLNSELRAKAEKEIAKRKAAIDRLEESANDPGDREDCQAQIAAAEAALDAIFREGL